MGFDHVGTVRGGNDFRDFYACDNGTVSVQLKRGQIAMEKSINL